MGSLSNYAAGPYSLCSDGAYGSPGIGSPTVLLVSLFTVVRMQVSLFGWDRACALWTHVKNGKTKND